MGKEEIRTQILFTNVRLLNLAIRWMCKYREQVAYKNACLEIV